MATNAPTSPNSNKRKRDPSSSDYGRASKTPNTTAADTPSAQNVLPEAVYNSLLQGLNEPVNAADESTRTAQAALQQQQQPPQAQQAQQSPQQAQGGQQGQPQEPHSAYPDLVGEIYQQLRQTLGGVPHMSPQGPSGMDASAAMTNFDARGKPLVGTPEWHQLRKDNHKEVERRRREVINEGIENIAKMIPGNEKNKGAILQRTCQYISELQNKIASFDNERHVFEITSRELEKRNENLRESARKGWSEAAKWMARCREANLSFDDYDESMIVEGEMEGKYDDGSGMAQTMVGGDENGSGAGP